MERTIGSGRYWLAAGLVSLCMTSCGDSSDEPESAATSVKAATSSATEPVTTFRSTTTLVRATSTTAVPAPSTTERVTTSVSTTTLGSATTSTAAPSTSDAPPQFPAARASLEHAGPAWVVILAGAPDFDDPVLVQAVSSAEVGGYSTSSTDCDFGAGEALGFPADEHVYTVSVYFETESDSQLALAAFRSHGIDGVVAEVRTFCMD